MKTEKPWQTNGVAMERRSRHRPGTSPGWGAAMWAAVAAVWMTLAWGGAWAADATASPLVEVKRATVEGSIDEKTARLVIQAALGGGTEGEPIVAVTVRQRMRVKADRIEHEAEVMAEGLRGTVRELVIPLTGSGELLSVTGEGMEDWSERRREGGLRALVVRFKASEPARTRATLRVTGVDRIPGLPGERSVMMLGGEPAVLGTGVVVVEPAEGLRVEALNVSGLTRVETPAWAPGMPAGSSNAVPGSLAFQFYGTRPGLSLRISPESVEARRPGWSEFQLEGQVTDDHAAMEMRGVVRVRHPAGGRMELLTGDVALSEAPEGSTWRLESNSQGLSAVFPGPGEYPVRVRFHARVTRTNGWNRVAFGVAPAAFAPVTWRGLGAETSLEVSEGAVPVRRGAEYVSFLPANGAVRLGWRPARTDAEGKLFFAVESTSQVTVSPGLLRQVAAFEARILQGELSALDFLVTGVGEIARVQGERVLSWALEPVVGTADRRLRVQFNEPQRERVGVQVEMQRALDAFPVSIDVPRVVAEGAVRASGQVRVLNEGAVRLEVLEATGLSQISPDQFVQTEVTRAWPEVRGGQVFAYRMAGPTTVLRVQADNILPELGVSQVLHYHLGENETAVEADLEVDVREAPLRELGIRIPHGYGLAKLTAAGVVDSFVDDLPGEAQARVRLVFGEPVAGRQSIQMRLERSGALTGSRWELGRIDVERARSVRGHVGVSSDAGWRLTPVASAGMTEVVAAFFPRKVAGMQVAMRLTEPDWSLAVGVERLAQSIQADVFHLFSVGEGIAYGSSLINYAISGAPVSGFRVELSPEYFNVEFVGRNLRSWQKVEGGYEVQLNGPASGAFPLLATYERPFKPGGDTLAFTGARPLEAQSEQGHVLVVSAYQFEVEPQSVSPSLTPLEPGEVPAEYRLFFDAPVLTAHRYTSRPFDLRLKLRSLSQVDTVRQVVERASLSTRLSEEGQVMTESRYFVKNKSQPQLRLRLPEGDDLWSVTVDGVAVVPVKDGGDLLLPLPGRADPNVLTEVQLTSASKARNASRVRVRAPELALPILKAEWRIHASAGHRVEYLAGNLVPAAGRGERTGFADLARRETAEARWAWGQRLALGGAAMLLAGGLLRAASRWVLRRFGLRFWATGFLAALAVVLMGVSWWEAARLSAALAAGPANELWFVVPVQPAGASWQVQVGHAALGAAGFPWVSGALLTVLALLSWGYSWLVGTGWRRAAAAALGWTLWVWVALRAPGGLGLATWVVSAFGVVHVLLPNFARWWNAGREASGGEGGGTNPAVAALVFGMLLVGEVFGPPARAAAPDPGVRAEQVTHELRVAQETVSGTARIRWNAREGAVLPLMSDTGVLTHSTHDPGLARLVVVEKDGRSERVLVALTNAALQFEIRYETRVGMREGDRGFAVPVPAGLVTRARLSLEGAEVEVTSPEAMSVIPDARAGTGRTAVELVLRSGGSQPAWISWRPRTRDARRERAVFYAEWVHLLLPGVGVLEGVHEVRVRPAQGEVGELEFEVARGMTVSRVEGESVVSWRYDPDAGRVRVGMSPAQSKPFALRVVSQVAVGSLPLEREVGLPSVAGAAGEMGMVGVGTGNDVQVDDVKAEGFATMNLEDFRSAMTAGAPWGTGVGEVVVRRAFRRSGAGGRVLVKASAVEPDVRVESQQTLSLSEDRVVLGAALTVDVIRAGVFKLSFPLPEPLSVESVSGPALSHWTELKTDLSGRVVTLHLKGKTQGQQAFNLVLTGPGLRSTNGWVAPRISLREATRQRGQMTVVPEQGLRLRSVQREGVTQLDPQQMGVRQKGALAFRLLQDPWVLTFDLERVDAWVQVLGVQHVAFGEALSRVTVNLQYEIENAGLKALVLRLPAAADSVKFTGEQVGQFAMLPAAEAGGTVSYRDWEVRLDRRLLGRYVLQASYTLPLAAQASEARVVGVRAMDASLQRGFLLLEGSGRLHVVPEPGASLQPADAQSIPRGLQEGIAGVTSSHVFRVVEPEYALPVRLERHQAARLLPARVTQLEMDTVVSDEGSMLTRARLGVVPGDKRLLHVKLPTDDGFWFALVNQHSVVPWQATNEILIPLERNAKQGEASTVEILYLKKGTGRVSRALDVELEGPRFDLPLENIRWNVHLNGRWQVRRWKGPLQLESQTPWQGAATEDVQSYLQGEAQRRKAETHEAEQFLNLANSLLVTGNPQDARRAFQAAYGLSQHDQAFNEDARVQLDNLRRQQALVGLNVRQSRVGTEGGRAADAPPVAGTAGTLAYTQAQAKQWMERNSAEENAIQERLAERLIQQQDAAVANPAAIRASLPVEGSRLTFTRPLEVNPWASLKLRLEARSTGEFSWGRRLLVLGVTFLGLALVSRLTRA